MKRTPITDTELLAKSFPEPEWIIPDLMPEGYTILSGLPKLGKSVLGLQIAEAVASGGILFGKKITKGNVLYIASEDNQRRLKNRLTANGHRGTDKLFFFDDWSYLDKEGFPELIEELKGRRKYRVCILDTMFRLLSPKSRQNDSAEMTSVHAKLQKTTNPDTGLIAAILSLMHHNKQAAHDENRDGISNISGSISIAGAMDTGWAVYRKRGHKDMTVEISGRDVEEQMLELTFDGLTKCYQVKSDIKPDSTQDQILRTVLPNIPTSPTEVAVTLNKQAGHIAREMAELEVKGRLVLGGKRGREILYIKVMDVNNPLSFLELPKK